MRIAFVVYDGMITLDFIGVFDPLSRLKIMGFLPDLAWDVCALSERVTDRAGLVLVPSKVGVPLSGYDVVILPGVSVHSKLIHDPAFMAWLRTAGTCRYKISVCTGSLLLGAAGFLRGKKATTHREAFSHLREYCQEVVDRRLVEDGDVITTRGITTAIDLGLYLCEKFAGAEAEEAIRKVLDYQEP